jgi:hypothetical protein
MKKAPNFAFIELPTKEIQDFIEGALIKSKGTSKLTNI